MEAETTVIALVDLHCLDEDGEMPVFLDEAHGPLLKDDWIVLIDKTDDTMVWALVLTDTSARDSVLVRPKWATVDNETKPPQFVRPTADVKAAAVAADGDRLEDLLLVDA